MIRYPWMKLLRETFIMFSGKLLGKVFNLVEMLERTTSMKAYSVLDVLVNWGTVKLVPSCL